MLRKLPATKMKVIISKSDLEKKWKLTNVVLISKITSITSRQQSKKVSILGKIKKSKVS
jgi:hypothetical protein